MANETINIGGKEVVTLRELLRPGLKAVFVGINPPPVSVDAGHYYQGRLGKRFWRRLQEYDLTEALADGAEDDAAFRQGYGFADVVRRPTARADKLGRAELVQGARDLTERLSDLPDRPLIIFVFAVAAEYADKLLRAAGFRTARMPGPYVSKDIEKKAMKGLRACLSEIPPEHIQREATSSRPPVSLTKSGDSKRKRRMEALRGGNRCDS